MKIKTDIHTHTNHTQHAYSTLWENAACAAKKGIELIAMTNHGPASHCHLERDHFKYPPFTVPRRLNELGITILRGAETNVLDDMGNLDLDNEILGNLDLVIASCHEKPYSPKTDKSFMRMYENLANNPQVDILGHICRNMPQDENCLDEVIELANKKGKLIEINQLSYISRKQHRVDASKILIRKLFEHKSLVVVNTDAHFCTLVGKFGPITEHLEQMGYPEELIINRDQKTLLEWLNRRENRRQISLDEGLVSE